MALPSILYAADDPCTEEVRTEPPFFVDLNLDQVVAAITAGKEEYDLKPLFYTPLRTAAAVRYRQEVMQDLEQSTLPAGLDAFAQDMRAMREHLALAGRLPHRWQRARWFLDAVAVYCRAVADLAAALASATLYARGLLAIKEYVLSYAQSTEFRRLQAQTAEVQADLAAVHYCLEIKGSTVKVRAYAGEQDYGGGVQQTFARFAQPGGRDYRVTFSGAPEANPVEGLILDRVALLFPASFAQLDEFCTRRRDYLDATLAQFDREVQFYLAYLACIARFRRQGLSLCYPDVAGTDEATSCVGGFDVALAYKLGIQGAPVVTNDFFLAAPERILVVTGPNQGGKTTFARSFGQLHYLGALGLPVGGRTAKLSLWEGIFTHFEVQENAGDLRSKLEDDIVRLQHILAQATPRSIIILNEVFSSTTLQDAVELGRKLLARISALDARCIYVTFIDELAQFDAKTVSMVSTVAPDNPTQRTFKIVRRPADGLAYAHSLAANHGLTYAQLKTRIVL